jgi:DNA polymerase-4
MSAYSAASRAVFEIFADTSPLVEGPSIDEALLDVRGSSASRVAARHRRGCAARCSSAAVCPSRSGGADEVPGQGGERPAKPDGPLVPPGGELALLHLLPVERLWGAGPPPPLLHDHGSRASARSPGSPSRRSSRLVGRAAGRKLHALVHNRDPCQ